jgi:hypothetical protein
MSNGKQSTKAWDGERSTFATSSFITVSTVLLLFGVLQKIQQAVFLVELVKLKTDYSDHGKIALTLINTAKL